MLMENEPDTDFTFALGGDTFMDLTHWKWNRSRDVVKFLDGRFLVLFREGDVPEDVLQERIGRVNRDEGGHARMLKLDTLQDVSSTMIRSTCDAQALEGMVAPRVLDYIVENKLYGFADQSI
jgi:nicotinic acid mononucleotide adenylyltransferase